MALPIEPSQTQWYADRMTIQIAVRIPHQLLAEVDRLVSAGDYDSRTDVVKAALERLMAEARERDLDAAIVAGYQRVPDAEADPWVDASTRAVVADEPW
jgi:Arc/MetJ-type ribon-helix-helix transcriptional regulator